MLRRFSQIVSLLLVGMTVLFLDFFSKAYIFHLFPLMDTSTSFPYGGIAVFHDFLGVDFSISLAINKGVAWGLFANFQILLIILRILVIGGLLVYLLFFNRDRLMRYPLVLIIAGAIGNVIDYFLYGYVIDFLHFNLWGYHFPVFNLADSSITIGVIWLLILTFFQKIHGSHKYSRS